jgi:DNA-binding transcriptional LysR family regulator
MNAQEDWDNLRYFLAVAREGSLSGAARRLRVNHTTVLRRVAALEATVGAALFDRLPSGYVLTAAGDEMQRAALKVEEDMAAVARRLAGADPRAGGVLRAATLDILAQHVLPRHIAGFQQRHPGIAVELLVGEASLNLTRREADVAIRATSRPPEHLVGRQVSGMVFAVYAGHGFAAKESLPPASQMDRLARSAWAGLDESFDHTSMNKWLYSAVPSERVVWRSNSTLALAAAVAADIGLGLLPCCVADQMEGLRRAGPVFDNEGAGVWLLTHGDLRRQYRVRVFLDMMGEAFAQERDLLEGRRPLSTGIKDKID